LLVPGCWLLVADKKVAGYWLLVAGERAKRKRLM
jgi:hypothetical protein